jgi:hypothetical protein
MDKLPTDIATYLDDRCASFEEGWDAAMRHVRAPLSPLVDGVLAGGVPFPDMHRAALALSDLLNEDDN